MAYPVADSYSCASGGVIAGGKSAIANTVGLMGDSLTADSYGLTNFYSMNAKRGGVLKLMANSGVSGETVQNMLSRVNNLYTNVSPGMAGLGALGRIFIRAGTNNARGNAAIASISSAYTSLLNTLATYAQKVIIFAVPPLEDVTNNGYVATYNAWLASFAAANPATFTFIDDCINVRNTDGSPISTFFNVDGVHFSRRGVAQISTDAAASLELSAYASPLSINPADVYPALPQWITNPFNTGTYGALAGGFSGTAATGFTVTSYGAGMAGLASIVAADAEDANQIPWQRIEITSGQVASQMDLKTVLSGRAMSTIDPSLLEVLAEVRFNNLDRTKISDLQMMIQANVGDFLSPTIYYDLIPTGLETGRIVIRNNRKRSGANTPTSATLHLYATARSTFTASSAGSIDIRRITARG